MRKREFDRLKQLAQKLADESRTWADYHRAWRMADIGLCNHPQCPSCGNELNAGGYSHFYQLVCLKCWWEISNETGAETQ
jgi:hypothetical protein